MKSDAKQQQAEAFPWDNVMTFGFAVLKLSSAEFWAMTPREIAHAMRAFSPDAAMAPSRNDLRKLMQLYPDNEDKHDN
ncbi:MAG: phage tail assembly chaperone [Hyphomicrobiales bacterium]